MKKILVSILFILFGTQGFAQSFDKGLEAYDAGDYATAMKEWKPLAEQGNASVQYNLGYMYRYGKGVLLNNAEALKWFRLAAEQGKANAQMMLGGIYKNGDGVLQDYAEAVKWFRLAAEKGTAEHGTEQAQAILGLMYQNGMGVPQDNVKAHMWTNIASANGLKEAGGMRDKLAAKMTASDISKAQAIARECMASDYKKCGD